MRYKELKPPAELEPFVKCFWYLNREYKELEDGEVLWPDGCYEIIFHYGAKYEVNGKPLDNSFLIGSLTHYHQLKAQGKIRLFGIRLKPWGLKLLSDTDVKVLRDKFIPLSNIFCKSNVENLQTILKDKELEEGVTILTEFLLGILKQTTTDDRSFITFLAELYENPVGQELQAIHEKSKYSQRQFQRKTIELTGLSPKKLSKVARFNQVRLKIFRNREIDLYDCMHEYGYYDYAHFSKDFKECIGLTPKEYKKWLLEKINPFKKMI
ncbi:AraC family transcriptional regulator [Priestia abyssalis]|uniref:AraC family transcriptional regulator n=1 Tax=Priestia abyssalis TaxID=1221450 RepID=UPI000994BC86|nr:helix-turn-helix domain-containing protein [Priestia abyssalis]